jgi:hypothetical protein
MPRKIGTKFPAFSFIFSQEKLQIDYRFEGKVKRLGLGKSRWDGSKGLGGSLEEESFV